MKNLFLFFPFIFSYTHQLLCIYDCPDFKIDISNQYHGQSNLSECKNNTRAIRCHGQIMIYYEDHKQKFISYSFGLRGHIIEKEIEELTIKNGFHFVIYFLFLVDSFQTNELIITVYIICQTDDNCALNYIQNLLKLYRQRQSPTHQLSPLLYASKELSTLTCYNYDTHQDEECPIDRYSTCMINKTGLFEQRCHSELNARLEYVFIITLLQKYSIIKILELIVCNLNSCNTELISKEIDNIVYNYTLFGLNITFSNSNKLNFSFLYLFIFINIDF